MSNQRNQSSASNKEMDAREMEDSSSVASVERKDDQKDGGDKMSHEEESSSTSTPGPPQVVNVTEQQGDGNNDDVTVPPLEKLDDEENSITARKRMSLPSPRRYFLYALGLWVAEFLIVIGLKRFGIIHHEFRLDETIRKSVLPPFDQAWIRLNESISLAYLTQEKMRPGFKLAQEGAKANYPIVVVPGFVTSGLEVWGGKECAKKHFRQRLWAAFGGARSFFMDRDCWREHMMLNPYTGGDPDGVRLRAASGFEAVDYFLGNYWVFGKIIENLADLGYSPSDMVMMPYDWRLAYPLLEERDGFFTDLKNRIELLHKIRGKKVVLTSHSMGPLVIHYFFAWVTTSEKEGGGGGGKKWVDEHIYSYINIAGAHLGVPKAATALLSGEMSDTVFMGTFGNMIEQFFGRRFRRDLWNTWGSLWTMLPKGGDALWGVGADMCASRSSDDLLCPENTLAPLIAMTDTEKNRTVGVEEPEEIDDEPEGSLNATVREFVARQSHSVQQINDFLLTYGASLGSKLANTQLHSISGREKPSSRTWHDPTRTPLPYAPNMKIYCLYGVGIETERAYYYQRNHNEGGEGRLPGLLDPPVILNASVTNESQNVSYGVRYADGDGSVPLLSLGYMCADAWQRKETGLNPSGTKVITREYEHRSEFCVDDPMRAGPASGEHVDILGNHGMLDDFLRVVSDFRTDEIQSDKIVSNIKELAKAVNAHPRGGIRKPKRWFNSN